MSIQNKKEICTIPTTILGDKYNNIESIRNIYVGPLLVVYQNSVVAAFMYQNECAINIFFLRQRRPTTNFLKFKANKNRYFLL